MDIEFKRGSFFLIHISENHVCILFHHYIRLCAESLSRLLWFIFFKVKEQDTGICLNNVNVSLSVIFLPSSCLLVLSCLSTFLHLWFSPWDVARIIIRPVQHMSVQNMDVKKIFMTNYFVFVTILLLNIVK